MGSVVSCTRSWPSKPPVMRYAPFGRVKVIALTESLCPESFASGGREGRLEEGFDSYEGGRRGWGGSTEKI